MRLTSRGKRRILVIGIVLGVAVCAVFAFVSLRGIYRARTVERSRAEGLAAYKSGDYETSLNKLSYVLSPNSTDMESLLAFADSRSRVPEVNNRHITTAVAYYNSALRVDPKNLEALTKLLNLYLRLRYRTEVGEVSERILALKPDDLDAWSAKASLAYQSQDYDQVISVAERMFQTRPADMTWRRMHIKALQAKGNREPDVLAVCDSWIAQFPKDVSFRLLKAQVLSEYGLQREARLEMGLVVEQGIDSAPMLESAIAMLELLEMRSDADLLITRSKQQFPDLSWVYESAIRRHWQASRIAEAVAELADAEKKFGPNRIALLKWKALLSAAVGDTKQTESALASMTELAKSSESDERDDALSWANAIRARIENTPSNWRQLADTYEHAISRQSHDPVLLFLLAEHYQRIGEHQLALTLLNQAASIDPNWLALHVARADALLWLNRAEEAFSIVGAVLKRSPSAGTPVYVLLCRAWFALGEKGDQIAIQDSSKQSPLTLIDLVRALHQQNKSDPQITRLLVDVLMRRGEAEQAKSVIQEALTNPATQPQTLLTLAESSVNWGLAMESPLLQEVARQSNVPVDMVIAHSRILNRLGRTQEAIELIDRAMPTAGPNANALRWQRAQIMIESNSPDADSAMLALISAEDRPPQLLQLLESKAVWARASVINAAVTRLREMFADRSPRVQLAYAEYLYRYKQNDPSAIAEALDMVNEVLKENPDSAQALSLMASLQISGDSPNPDESIRYLKRAVDLQPNDLILLTRLVAMLQERGDFETARQYLTTQAADRGDVKWPLVRSQAQMLEDQGEFELALEKLRSLPESELDEASRIRWAQLLAKLGDASGAEAQFERLLQAPTATVESYIAAAHFHGSRGRLELAKSLLEQGIPKDQLGLAAFHVGTVFMAAGDFRNAEVELKRAAELTPNDPRVFVELTKLYAALGAPMLARDAALRGLQLDPTNESVQAMLAMISFSLDQSNRAPILDALARLERKNSGLERMLRLYGALAAPTEADLAEAQKVVREFPRRSAAWKLAVTLHANAQRWDDAVRLAQQAVAWLPADAATHEACARLLIQTGRTEEALDMARAWRRLALQDSLIPDSVIAALLLDLNRFEDAFRAINPHAARLQSQSDRYPEQVEVCVMAMLEANRHDQAMTIMRPLVEQAGQWRSRFLGIAMRMREAAAKQVLALIEPLMRTPQEQFEMAASWIAVAKGFQSNEPYQRAEQLLTQASSEPSLRLDSMILRGDIASGMDDASRAEELYRTVLKDDPRNLAALNNLAYLLVRRATNCDEAVTLARKAAELSKNHPAVMDTLAQALLCAGKYSEAEPVVQSIMSQRPRDPSPMVTLAEIRQRQGRARDARSQLLNAKQSLAELKVPDRDLNRRVEALEKLLSDEQASRNHYTPALALSR